MPAVRPRGTLNKALPPGYLVHPPPTQGFPGEFPALETGWILHPIFFT